MIRAVLDNGVIRPVEALPSGWSDGQELLVEEAEARPSAEELHAWSQQIEAGAAAIPEEEHQRFLAAIAQHRREGKERTGREIGLLR